MAPKVKITKEQIVETALTIVRMGGEQAINARTVAHALGCSTQPVFSNFRSMEQLRLAVAQRAAALLGEYLQREQASGEYPPYKANGMAYIRFAKEEPALFRLLYLCDKNEPGATVTEGLFGQMCALAQSAAGLSAEQAQLFHLEIWAVVHGIATMFATGFLDLDWALVSNMITDTYQGLRLRFTKE